MTPEDEAEETKPERRQFLRVRMDTPGRLFLPSENREAHCQIVDLSPGGAQIVGEFVPTFGTQVVLYIDGFGRFEGIIIHPGEGTFGVRFLCSAAKRERIAEQLTLFLNKELAGENKEPAVEGIARHYSREQDSREQAKGLSRFTRANGNIVTCEVLDLSLGGVSLKTRVRPPLGEVVLIGQTAGRVARHHQNGIAIEFLIPQTEKSTDQPANPFTVVG